MGTYISSIKSYRDVPLVCANHPTEQASAFCAKHKVFVCFSCIITRKHFENDCDMIELKNVTDDMKECLKTREVVRIATEKLMKPDLEEKLERQIDNECDREIARFQKLKLELRSELKKKLNDIRIEKRASHAECLKLLDDVFALLRSNRRTEAHAVMNQLRAKRVCDDVIFQLPTQVKDQSGYFKKSDTSLFQYLEVIDAETEHVVETGRHSARGEKVMSAHQVPGRSDEVPGRSDEVPGRSDKVRGRSDKVP